MANSHSPLDAQRVHYAFRTEYARVVDEGFTLLELVLTLAVVGILLAVAIPTFLSTGKSANDRGSQQNLNTALVDSSNMFQMNGQTFALGTPAQYSQFASLAATSLATSERELAFTTSASSSPATVSVYVSAGGNGIVLANRAASGTCWYAIDNPRAISTTVNNAYKLRPYGTGTAAATSTPSPKTGTTAAQVIYFPTTPGTYYAEVNGDSVSADCSASNPKLTGSGAKYQLAKSTIPG